MMIRINDFHDQGGREAAVVAFRACVGGAGVVGVGVGGIFATNLGPVH